MCFVWFYKTSFISLDRYFITSSIKPTSNIPSLISDDSTDCIWYATEWSSIMTSLYFHPSDHLSQTGCDLFEYPIVSPNIWIGSDPYLASRSDVTRFWQSGPGQYRLTVRLSKQHMGQLWLLEWDQCWFSHAFIINLSWFHQSGMLDLSHCLSKPFWRQGSFSGPVH